MKKSIRNLVLGAVMAVSVFGASSSALAYTQYVQTDMNFRKGPAVTATLIGSVPAGAKVDVVESKNGWDLVTYNGVTGYIHGGNVADSYSAPAKTKTNTNTNTGTNVNALKNYFDNNSSFNQAAKKMIEKDESWKTVRVSEGYLALRNAPSYDTSNEIGKLFTGDTVLVVGEKAEGSYVKVYSPKYNGYGFVNAGFLF